MADYSIEATLGAHEGRVIAALDEVGRGCLSGPVVAACCIFPPSLIDHPELAGIDDSKRLSAARRARLAASIERLLPFGVGQASVAEIDAHNILQATFFAMRRALADLVAAIHSPRAGARLSEVANDRRTTIIAAISEAAAAACGSGWEEVGVAGEPNDKSLLALAASLCHKSDQ